MRRIVSTATVCAGAWLLFQPVPVRAQAPDLQALQNSKIEIAYDEPTSGEFFDVYQRLKKRQTLERLKGFLSPLRLKRKLILRHKQCNTVNAFYSPGDNSLNLCYDFFADLEKKVAAQPVVKGFSKEQALVGGFIGVALHEMGHGVVNLLEIPVFGREEDAADQIAAFTVMQFGPQLGRYLIRGAAQMWLAKDQAWERTAFSDEHGTERQRYYNFLCLGYGADPATFKDIVDQGLLPKERAADCGREYQRVKNAFTKTILPFVDLDMMKKVQATSWLRPEDMK